MTKSVLVRALLIALVAGAGFAQTRPDPQSTFEPRSQPGAGQTFLEKFVGDWDVVKIFYPQSGEPARSTGVCHQKMINEGRFLESDFVFERDGPKTTGLGIIGFEPEPGVFTSVWVDSRSTRMSLRRSEGRFDGEQIVLQGRTLDSETKGGARTRTVTRLEDGGRRIAHRQYLIQRDGNERLMMELILTRKNG